MQIDPNLLNQLHDIKLPEPVGWWPLAYTWWVLIFTVVSILIGLLWYYFDQKRRNRYRKTALHQVESILLEEKTNHDKIAAINALLKQVALTAYGRSKTAALHDQAWLDFLSKTASYIPQPEHLHAILNRAYLPEPNTSAETLKLPYNSQQALDIWQKYAQDWIKGHHQ